MTYVFGGTLSLTQSINQSLVDLGNGQDRPWQNISDAFYGLKCHKNAIAARALLPLPAPQR